MQATWSSFEYWKKEKKNLNTVQIAKPKKTLT